MRGVASAAAIAALAVTLVACVPSAPAPDDGASAPIGPVPPAGGSVTLPDVLAIVTEADAGPTMSFGGSDGESTAGDDLASENDYWVAVAGEPASCAAVVSAPYLVSGHDTGERLDDPTALIGTLTEIDEERFGLIQVYARQFDDATVATGFFDEFTGAVAGCPSYRLTDYAATDLAVTPATDLPAGETGLDYSEVAGDDGNHRVSVTFLQRDAVVISVYAELLPNSTITAADASALVDRIAGRLAVL